MNKPTSRLSVADNNRFDNDLDLPSHFNGKLVVLTIRLVILAPSESVEDGAVRTGVGTAFTITTLEPKLLHEAEDLGNAIECLPLTTLCPAYPFKDEKGREGELATQTKLDGQNE